MQGSLTPSLTKCGFTNHEFLDKTRPREYIYNQMSAYAFGISSNLCTQLPFQECLEGVTKVAQGFHLNFET
jgi:hypothetical protein